MIGDRIRYYRIEKELTQTALSKLLFVTPGAVSQWEKGLTAPSADQLVPLADALGVTVDDLLEHDIQKAADKGGMREQVMRLHDEIDGLTDDESDLVLALVEKIKGARKPL